MTEQPLVSVIINCYNGEKYLREAIDSVLKQTYQNWEIVFWDNQSTDSTREIVMGYQCDKLHYYYAKDHTSLGKARNLAITRAEGALISFLDSDDIWDPVFLEKLIALFNSYPDLALAYSDYCRFGDENGIYLSGESGLRSTTSLLKTYDIGMSSVMIKKECLNKYGIEFNECFNLIEDYAFFIQISTCGSCFHLKKALTKYRVYSDSTSRVFTTWHDEYLSFYSEVKNKWIDNPDLDEWLSVIYRNYLYTRFLDELRSHGSLIRCFYYLCFVRPVVRLFECAKLLVLVKGKQMLS